MAFMQRSTLVLLRMCGAVLLTLGAAGSAAAQGVINSPDTRPYDERLMRLSEISGRRSLPAGAMWFK